MTAENIKKAFSLFDADNDGHIDADEFKFALPKATKGALRHAKEPTKAGMENMTTLVVSQSLKDFKMAKRNSDKTSSSDLPNEADDKEHSEKWDEIL